MWLRQLRKLVSLYQHKCAPLRREPRRARRRGVGLKLETLEDRTLPSTLTVANLNDSYFFSPGDGSLRGEIAIAQNGDTIQFSPTLAGGRVVLIGGELLINKSLTIVGLTNSAGAPNITVWGFASGRDFDIKGSTSSFNVTIQDLNVTDGLVGDSAPNVADAGAGLLVQDVAGGNVTLTNLVVSGNTARGGNGGTPAAKTFTGAAGGSGNNAQGAGLYISGGTVQLTGDTFSGNYTVGGNGGHGGQSLLGAAGAGGAAGNADGAGLFINDGDVQLTNDVFNGNSGQGGNGGQGGESILGTAGAGGAAGDANGGGLFINGGNVQLTNTTFARNSALGGLGGAGAAGGTSGVGVAGSNGGAISSGGDGGTGGSGGSGAPGAAGGTAFGGGLAVSAGQVQVTGGSLSDNTAQGGVGGVGGIGGNGGQGGTGGKGKDGFVAAGGAGGNGGNGGIGGTGGAGGFAGGGGLGVTGGQVFLSNGTFAGNQAKGGTGAIVSGRGGTGGQGGAGGAGNAIPPAGTSGGTGGPGGMGGVGGVAGVGGAGGIGGSGQGGGLYASGGTVQLSAESLTSNFAQGGIGGAAAPGGGGGAGGQGGTGGHSFIGGFGGPGGTGGPGAPPQPGGDGGDGQGGALAIAGGTVLFVGKNTLSQNTAEGGLGGAGGVGGPGGPGGVGGMGGNATATAPAGAAGGSGGVGANGSSGGLGGSAQGGGLYVGAGSLQLAEATISDNLAYAAGGGSGLGGGPGGAGGPGGESGTGGINGSDFKNGPNGANGSAGVPGSTSDGGIAQGGGLYAASGVSVQLTDDTLDMNLAQGANTLQGEAGTGPAGGVAEGGAVYVAGGTGTTLTITNSAISGNTALGGHGGQGATGVAGATGAHGANNSGPRGGSGGSGGIGGIGGVGGIGGAAQGGGLYATGSTGVQIQSDSFSYNSAQGGTGGVGGDGGQGGNGGQGGQTSAGNNAAGGQGGAGGEAGIGGEGGAGGPAQGGSIFSGTTVVFAVAGTTFSDNAATGGLGGLGGTGGDGGNGGSGANGASVDFGGGGDGGNGGPNAIGGFGGAGGRGGDARGGALYVSGSTSLGDDTLAANTATGGSGGPGGFAGSDGQPGQGGAAGQGGFSSSNGNAGNAGTLNQLSFLRFIFHDSMYGVGTGGPGANADGAGLYAASGSTQLVNDTVSGNGVVAGTSGVGDSESFAGTALGGGLFELLGASLIVNNTIVAGNSAGLDPDVVGTVSGSNNLIGAVGDSSGFDSAHGDLIGVNPDLAKLGNYGGPTQTMLLLPGSPAIGAGNAGLSVLDDLPGESLSLNLLTDQRGYPRTVEAGTVDIGATEYQYDLAISENAAPTVPTRGTVTYSLTVTNNGPDPTPAGVVLTDPLPAGTTLQSLSPLSTWTAEVPAVGPGGTITLTSIGGLTSGASTTFQVVVDVPSSASVGTMFRSTPSVSTTASNSNASNSATVTTKVVAPVATSLEFVQQPNSTLAGMALNTVQVEVLNQFGSLFTSDNSDRVTLSGARFASGASSVTVHHGVATFSKLVIDAAGPCNLCATSGKMTQANSSTFTISATVATHFAIHTPATVTAGQGFTFTLTALDRFGNTATDYSGTIHLTSSDSHTVLPADTTLTDGTGTFDATLDNPGTWSLTATDTHARTLRGTSHTIKVTAAKGGSSHAR